MIKVIWIKLNVRSDGIVTARIQFLPSPAHESDETCLCCCAMSGLMKLACMISWYYHHHFFLHYCFVVIIFIDYIHDFFIFTNYWGKIFIFIVSYHLPLVFKSQATMATAYCKDRGTWDSHWDSHHARSNGGHHESGAFQGMTSGFSTGVRVPTTSNVIRIERRVSIIRTLIVCWFLTWHWQQRGQPQTLLRLLRSQLCHQVSLGGRLDKFYGYHVLKKVEIFVDSRYFVHANHKT